MQSLHIIVSTCALGFAKRARSSSCVPHPLQYTYSSAPGRVSGANTSGSLRGRLLDVGATMNPLYLAHEISLGRWSRFAPPARCASLRTLTSSVRRTRAPAIGDAETPLGETPPREPHVTPSLCGRRGASGARPHSDGRRAPWRSGG